MFGPTWSDMRNEQETLQRRIQTAIFRVSERVPLDERGVLDKLIPFVSAAGSKGVTRFPPSLQRMPLNPDRSAVNTMPGLLYFHVWNAVATYHDLLHGLPVRRILESRLQLLEQLGSNSLRQFRVTGNKTLGFALCHRDEAAVSFLAPDGDNTNENTEKL